jgi:ATP-dependent Lhr-like helicase
MAGAVVVLVDGALAAWMARGERQLLTFAEGLGGRNAGEVCREIARALAGSVGIQRRRALLIGEVDGVPSLDSPMAGPLADAGFIRTSRGFLKRIGD